MATQEEEKLKEERDYTARQLGKCVDAIRALLAWEREMGGWEAPCWQGARRLMNGESEGRVDE